MTGNATYHVRERIYSHYSNMSDNKLAYSNAIVVWESIAKKKWLRGLICYKIGYGNREGSSRAEASVSKPSCIRNSWGIH